MGVSRRDVEQANIPKKFWGGLLERMPDSDFTETINRLANDSSYYDRLWSKGHVVVLTTEANSAVRDLGVYLIKGAVNQGFKSYMVSSDRIIQCSFNRDSKDFKRTVQDELKTIKKKQFLLISETKTNQPDPVRKVIRSRFDNVLPTFCSYRGSESDFRDQYEHLSFTINEGMKFINVPDNWRLSL